MSTDMTYAGWTNRETWAVALYLNNDEGLQNETAELTRLNSASVADLAREIETLAENIWTVDGWEFSMGETRPVRIQREAEDIGSLYRVNWTEIAASFIEDLEG